MQVRITRSLPEGLAETEEIAPLTAGTILDGVEAVHLCRHSPELRSVQVRKADGVQYYLVPAVNMAIIEGPHWQAYARRMEEAVRERNRAALEELQAYA